MIAETWKLRMTAETDAELIEEGRNLRRRLAVQVRPSIETLLMAGVEVAFAGCPRR
jgi:hypothetical protein